MFSMWLFLNDKQYQTVCKLVVQAPMNAGLLIQEYNSLAV